MADGALRCFASLADRFTRRGVDPAPLAQHGLIDELLQRLQQAGELGPNVSTASTPGNVSIQEAKSSPSISTVISLLSTLCRGSPTITHDLLRSDLPDAIESGLRGDERSELMMKFEFLIHFVLLCLLLCECSIKDQMGINVSGLLICRCSLDTMRLVDLLLVLLFEGRKALPKAGISSISSRLSGLRRSDSAGNRSHRQLIDCIRSKDTDALIDAIDNGKKVNHLYLFISTHLLLV